MESTTATITVSSSANQLSKPYPSHLAPSNPEESNPDELPIAARAPKGLFFALKQDGHEVLAAKTIYDADDD
ncbi:unnamed protein product [Schistocephalus solidus]|uniref:Uncharacterized protein n=1 Tax=Schistocephalus solidus TaxID=70667 RepID=A0A183SAL8_SCHSO|nr:unnamed protein product [Schistocephalus solidus]